MVFLTYLLAVSLLPVFTACIPSSAYHGHTSHCPSFKNGTFNIHQFQLYPENAAWDSKNCVLYITYDLDYKPSRSSLTCLQVPVQRQRSPVRSLHQPSP